MKRMNKSRISKFGIILSLVTAFLLFGCSKDNESKALNTFNVADFGATPDDGTDDTKSFQDAIDAVAAKGGGTVFVPQGDYVVDAVKSIRLKNNITLKLDPKAKLIAKPNDKESYKVLHVRDVKNVKIIGGTIQGERYTHTGTGGEWGMGISLYGGKNITIQNILISDCWGDGVYINGESENVTLKNIKSIGNRRQGMSITSAHNVTVTGSEFSETRGTNPQTGIDIEPNEGESVSQVTIKNCVFKNNEETGFQVGASKPNTQISDILVTENYFAGNHNYTAVFGGIKPKDKVYFTNNTFDKAILQYGTCSDCIIQDRSN